MRIYAGVLFWIFSTALFIDGQTKPPEIAFDSISRDMGRITEGEVLRLIFSFSNKGNGILEILGVEPS